MKTAEQLPATDRYAKCIAASKRVRWDIDLDVIRGRSFDFNHDFLPAGLTLVDQLPFLERGDRRLYSHTQGRTYANMFGLVERFIGAKMVEISGQQALGDQVAFEALIRFTDEELKHQELFRRLEVLAAHGMPAGYRFLPEPDPVAKLVLSKSSWSVLALTCHIEVFTQVHYRESIADNPQLSPLFKDVLLYHWREESQHALLDEMEWQRADAALGDAERDSAVDDLIALVGAVDGLLQVQATSDAGYLLATCAGRYTDEQQMAIRQTLLQAYRWQYIVSGIKEGRFMQHLQAKLNDAQMQRIATALGPLLA